MWSYHLPSEKRHRRWILRAVFVGLAGLLPVFTAGGCAEEAAREATLDSTLKQIGLWQHNYMPAQLHDGGHNGRRKIQDSGIREAATPAKAQLLALHLPALSRVR